MSSRRELLKMVGAFVAGFAIGGAAIREAFPKFVEKVVERERLVTAGRETGTALGGLPKFKAGFVYVGPIGDLGWTYSHDRGRRFAEERLPFLETTYVESVPEGEASGVIDQMVKDGAQLVFTTSFGYMRSTKDAAKRYSDRFFAHCSGYLEPGDPENFIEYFIDLYEAYYLNGIMAGAITKTDKLGYVAAFLIPEVKRHLNAFLIGAREVNPRVTMDVIEIGSWFDPAKARSASETLIGRGADVLAFTEDSPTVLIVAQEKGAWSFSHYSDMYDRAPKAHVSGQMVNWGPMYLEIILRAYMAWLTEDMSIWSEWPPERPRDYWWSMKNSWHGYDWRQNPTDIYLPMHEVVPREAQDYVMLRRRQIMEGVFDPYSGPIKDREGMVRVQVDERTGKSLRLSKDELYGIDWLVEGVENVATA